MRKQSIEDECSTLDRDGSFFERKNDVNKLTIE